MITKINKKVIKKIKEGDIDTLLEAIDFLVSGYDAKAFDEGYNSCLADLSVYSTRLAEKITAEAELKNKAAVHNGEKYYLLEPEETAAIIEEFFNEIRETKDNADK